MRRYAMRVESPLGPLRLVADEGALVGLYTPGQAAEAAAAGGTRERGVPTHVEAHHPVLVAARRQLEEWFAGERTAFALPLRMEGTEFQRAVWEALGAIPFGATSTYAALARRLGRPSAARAVGAANGRNPIAIIVPCHRVVGADGALTGYAGGLAAKRWLLSHEAAVGARAAGQAAGVGAAAR